MSYQTPITIKDAIKKIQKKQFVLPSIQREFVWSPEQIEKLFDSLMRKYPISTFLFWKVDKSKVKDFQFYEFLKDYHEKKATHNKKADLSPDDDVIAILDGQQRLTSLYVALLGTYAKKIPYYRWSSEKAFPEKKLYLNLLEPAEDIEMEYDFQFLTKAESEPKPGKWWFPVSKVLSFIELPKALAYLIENGLMDTSVYTKDQSNFALNTLSKLYSVINENGTISYFQEEDEKLDKVLQIFIRINSGGTKLSYSDLLLSIATAQWKERDARQEIHSFVDSINKIGDGFDFNKDFVLKSCLVLGDFGDIKFKVDNFKKENMMLIESIWDDISNAIRIAVKLVSQFGFNRETLTSSNALIPLAYFLFKKNLDETFLSSSNQSENRKLMKEWLIRSLLKRTFGGTPDNLYPVYRNLINDGNGQFPLERIFEYYKGDSKSIKFTADDLEQLLEMHYHHPLVYSTLSLVYPGLIQSTRYHVDHIHPQKFFTSAKLNKEGIPQRLHNEYWKRYNNLPNLQLLPATENTEKNGRKLDEWFNANYAPGNEQDNYKKHHHFPLDASLNFQDLIEFYEGRKKILRRKLAEALGIELKDIEKNQNTLF